MSENPLRGLQRCGQSVWLDYIRRDALIEALPRFIAEDGLSGVTSNPAIFDKAIVDSHDYDHSLAAWARQGRTAREIYEDLVIEDVQRAADLLRPVFDQRQGHDGFVSLEVSPHLAHDTAGTLAEARRLWRLAQRPNVMIKVPATLEGLPAIQQLLAEGLNINVTLLFGLPRYRQVAEAWMNGLAARVAAGQPVASVASVASFFLSRIDVLLDPRLEQIGTASGPRSALAAALRGEVAIASAKVAYQIYKELLASDRFKALAAAGVRPQRLLWASTSTKNPAYSDEKDGEPLSGPDTVNTVPLETFHAYRDHGRPAPRLEQDLEHAQQVLAQLAELGIDLDAATQELEDQGVAKFVKPFDQLLGTLERRRAQEAQGPEQPSPLPG